MMTAEMIEWTLILLEWIKDRIHEEWPEARLRGSAPDGNPEGYRIRFRENGDEYWMVILPEVILKSAVQDVQALLEAEDWLRHLRKTGCIHVGMGDRGAEVPSLQPCPYGEV